MALMLQPHAEGDPLRRAEQNTRPSSRPPPDSTHPSSSGRKPGSRPDSRHGERPSHDKGSRGSDHDRGKRKDSSRSHRLPSSSQRHHSHRDDSKAVLPYKDFSKVDSANNRLKRPSTFLCNIFFSNGLPEPATQPKLLPLKTDPNRYTEYVGSSLEREYRHRLHLEPDLGIPLDLLDLSPYIPPPEGERPLLDPADEALLRDDDISTGPEARWTPLGKTAKGTPRPLRLKDTPSVEGLNWLMSTQYITPMTAANAAAKKKSAMTEQEVKLLALQLELEDDQKQLSTREGRIRYIEQGFTLAQEPPRHPTNPDAVPLEILPILPFQERDSQRFLHVVFDEPPLKDVKKYASLDAEGRADVESLAMMKQYKTTSTVAGEPGKPFLAYMVPSTNSKEKVEMAWEERQDVPYTWVREYHYNLHVPKGDKDKETFVFCYDDESIKYLKVKGKLQLDKLKKIESARNAGQQHEEDRLLSRIPVPSEIRIRKAQETVDLNTSKKARRKEIQEEDE